MKNFKKINILVEELLESTEFTYLGRILIDEKETQNAPSDITSIKYRFQKEFFYIEYETISKLLKIYKFKYNIPNKEYRKTEMSHNWWGEYQPFFNENIVFKGTCKSINKFRIICKLLEV